MLEIKNYNQRLTPESKVICDWLLSQFKKALPGTEAKIWHGHPFWFHNGNPIIGYSQMKATPHLRFLKIKLKLRYCCH